MIKNISTLQSFQLFDKYLRWRWDLNRRETFEEAVDRNIDYAKWLTKEKLDDEIYELLRTNMLNFSVFPSMRFFQNAGEPAKNHPQSIFNCAYMPIIDVDCFGETLHNLGLGIGQGYSVEKRFVDLLPEVGYFYGSISTPNHVVEDSLKGWKDVLDFALTRWFKGIAINIDYSKIRPAGSPLKTRGGTASGSEPFKQALNKISLIMYGAQGRKLKPIEVHDILCYIASAIVSGGHRRSAMIALFDKDDQEMLNCKTGEWYKEDQNPQRAFANNSFVVEEKWGIDTWRDNLETVFNGYGEPGIYSRYAAKLTMPERRSKDFEFGCNPCGEVNLRPFEFCNLSIANIRSNDKPVDIFTKAYIAAIWGTIQSCVQDFPELRKEWTENQIEERLLGVDLNGQRDNPLFNNPENSVTILKVAQDIVIETNAMYAAILGINQSAATTVAKPAGNSSTLFDTASGIGKRYSKFYVRRVQCSFNSPVGKFLMAQGVPYDFLRNTSKWSNSSIVVFEFPVKSPEGSVFKKDENAIEQLQYWKTVKLQYCEHNPSFTVDYEESEKKEIVKWIYENQNIFSGIAFMPKDTTWHPQMPYEEIDENTYKKMVSEMPHVNWDNLKFYDYQFENEQREFACSGDACEVL